MVSLYHARRAHDKRGSPNRLPRLRVLGYEWWKTESSGCGSDLRWLRGGGGLPAARSERTSAQPSTAGVQTSAMTMSK